MPFSYFCSFPSLHNFMVVDAVSCGIYIYKDLYFTSFLYGLYAVIACFGYLKWKQLMNLSYERV